MRGLATEIMLMQTVAVITFVALMLTVFSIKGNLTLAEGLLTDPSLPLLQSVSYSTVDYESECSGVAGDCDLIHVYDLLSMAGASSNEEIEVCGGTCNVTSIVSDRLSDYETDITRRFGLSLKNATRDVVFEMGSTPSKLSEQGFEIKKVEAVEYLIPLPPDSGDTLAVYCLLTQVETGTPSFAHSTETSEVQTV